VELLEDVALAASTASSSQASGLEGPFRPLHSSGQVPTPEGEGFRIRSRFLARLLDRPRLEARAARMAAHMAAQAAQVNFALLLLIKIG